jgi:acyl-coenzyme A thioesterase PaaI-like protein
LATFEDATTVAGGEGFYTAELDPMWTVGGNPHGGYLLALMARAAIAADDDASHPHPLAASAVYLSPPSVGPATVTVEVLRRGRLASQIRAQLRQQDRVHVDVQFTLGRLDPDTEPYRSYYPPPDVAPFDQCRRGSTDPRGTGVHVGMLDMVDQRLDMSSLGKHDKADPNPYRGGSGELRGWVGFADGTPFDPVSLLYVVDSFPPATFTIGTVGWVPTMTLTAYIRALPSPGSLRMRQRVGMLAGNLADQVCEVWDGRGRLVAQATQLDAVRLDPAALLP